MIDPKHIPHLINLLDDESPEVQENIIQKLSSFGPTLKDEVRRLSFSLNSIQEKHIAGIFSEHKKTWLKYVWPTWFNLKSDISKLEGALSILAEFLNPPYSELRLKDSLDQIATAYRDKFRSRDPKILAQFLFKEMALKGNEEDYYSPKNSNLINVIESKQGIPISMASIYMLVGVRLGIPIEGCNFPGHFLARINLNGKTAFVDCFSGGQVIYESDIVRVRGDKLEGIEKILSERADAETIIRRYLANLIRAFQMQDNITDTDLMIELFKELDDRLTDKEILDLTPEDIIADFTPIFEPGEIVRHKRYGYRGIIVDIDPNCDATDNWYYSNQTQPNRDQSWMHLLVHGSDQVTYVAESNLIEDNSEESIVHPLLTHFFTKEENGQYFRNDNNWPETDF